MIKKSDTWMALVERLGSEAAARAYARDKQRERRSTPEGRQLAATIRRQSEARRARQKEKSVKSKLVHGKPFVVRDIDWPDHCPITGAELSYSFAETNPGHQPDFILIDPTKGWATGNVAVISRAVKVVPSLAVDPDALDKIAAYVRQLRAASAPADPEPAEPNPAQSVATPATTAAAVPEGLEDLF